MRISSLALQNIGPFEQEKFTFQPVTEPEHAEIHLFTGVNGSGKSTLLHALASMITPNVVGSRFRYHDDRSLIHLGLCLDHEETTIKIGYQNNQLAILSRPDALTQYRSSLGSQHTNFVYDFAVIGYSGTRSIGSQNFRAIQEIAIHPLKGAIQFQQVNNPQPLFQWIANTKAKYAFAQQENNPTKADRYRMAITHIEDAIEQIIGYPVHFQFSYEPLSIHISVDGEELEVDALPDGLKSIISWIADLLMRLDRLRWREEADVLARSFILFLDEIDIHLHPAWQRRILPVVQKLFPNAQIFIATHSPFVVASIDDAWVYKLEVENGYSHLTQVQEAKAGSSYPTVLDEIFGIDDYFDVETERIFEQFYKQREQILTGQHEGIDALLSTAHSLSEKSIEVRDIIGRELRQLQRITGISLQL